MRITSSVTSISWIPSEAITGALKLPFAFGVALWDPPLPDVVDDLQALHDAPRFRFANDLRAWVEVDDDGRITDAGTPAAATSAPRRCGSRACSGRSRARIPRTAPRARVRRRLGSLRPDGRRRNRVPAAPTGHPPPRTCRSRRPRHGPPSV